MKAVFFIASDKYGEAKRLAYADEDVSKATIIIREHASIGMPKAGYYLMVDGEDKAIKKAREILHECAAELSGDEASKVITAIEEQESSAAAGFGAIFG